MALQLPPCIAVYGWVVFEFPQYAQPATSFGRRSTFWSGSHLDSSLGVV